MGKVKDTMKQIGIRNRLRKSSDINYAFSQWLFKKHPEIIQEYIDSEFFKILTRTNKYASVMEAIHFLNTGKDE